MSATRQVVPPLNEAAARGLRVGERVLISGRLYTARDAAHKRLVETLAAGGEAPFPLEGAIVYYVGPAPARPGEVIGSAGPTTSSRMDAYTPALLACGLRGMIGKGKRDAATREAMVTYGGVYFVAVGGAAALIAACIRQVDVIAYQDLGTEAIYRLMVEDFPAVVANDAHGGDLYEAGRAQWTGGGG
jgi:fumarate hydratase subunit beta